MGCSRLVTSQDLKQMQTSSGIDETDTVQLDTQALKIAASHYDVDRIAEVVDFYSDAPDYVNAIVECLNEVAEIGITGMEEVVADLMMGGQKAKGAEHQLSYILKHKSEIAEVEVPRAMFRKDDSVYPTGGPDILNKDGSVVELKNYNFNSDHYRHHAEETVAKVVKQARDRVDNLGAPRATIVFAGWHGSMPAEFESALNRAIGSDSRIDWRVE